MFFFIVHSYVCIHTILSSGYNNDYTATALRTATITATQSESIIVVLDASSVFEMCLVLTNIHVLN